MARASHASAGGDTPLSPHYPAAGMTPGGYIRDCRRRARRSIVECARAVATSHTDVARVRERLAELEANRPGDYGPLLRTLKARKVFPFSIDTFAALAAPTNSPDHESFDL